MIKSLKKFISLRFSSSSSSQIKSYQDLGYAIFPNFVPIHLIDELKSHVSNLIDKEDFSQELLTFKTNQQHGGKFLETGSTIHYFFEEYALDKQNGLLKVPKQVALNKIGHAMHDLDPIFHKFSYRNEYKQILRAIGYKKPILMQTMYIFKNPKKGSKVDPHTDNTYLITSPPSTIGFWVALDDANKGNGCLWGVPASQKTKTTLFMKRTADGKGTFYEEKENPSKNVDIKNAVPLEVKKGSLVIFHGDFVHYSEDNHSDVSRNAFTMHFVESENTKWGEENWLQRTKELPAFDYYTTD